MTTKMKYDAHLWANLVEAAISANDCPSCKKKGEPCWCDLKGRRYIWDGNNAHRCIDEPPTDIELWDK
jgi:hypothetical protein